MRQCSNVIFAIAKLRYCPPLFFTSTLISIADMDIKSLKDYPKYRTTINNWVTRYEKFGIIELKNKLGQGRKCILNPAIHFQKVKEIVKS